MKLKAFWQIQFMTKFPYRLSFSLDTASIPSHIGHTPNEIILRKMSKNSGFYMQSVIY